MTHEDFYGLTKSQPQEEEPEKVENVTPEVTPEDINSQDKPKSNYERGVEVIGGVAAKYEAFVGKYNNVADKVKAVPAKVGGFFSRLFGSAKNKGVEAVGAVAGASEKLGDKAAEIKLRVDTGLENAKKNLADGYEKVVSNTHAMMEQMGLDSEKRKLVSECTNVDRLKAEKMRYDKMMDEKIAEAEAKKATIKAGIEERLQRMRAQQESGAENAAA